MTTKLEKIQEMDRVIGYLENADSLNKENIEQIKQETKLYTAMYLTGEEVTGEEPLVEWKAEGEYYYDIDGRKYIDFSGGGTVSILGHCNPKIVDPVKKFYKRMALHTHELVSVHKAYLSKAMAELAPGELSMLTYFNSETENTEMALKAARIATGGEWFLSTVNAYHGDTMGAFSVTGRASGRKPYFPMLQYVQFVEYGNADDMREAVRCLVESGDTVGGIIVEPIQYEGGVNVAPEGYLKALRELCDEYKIALIFDEMATCQGRTGTLWRCEAENVVPDILMYGRGFAGGILPMSGFICKPWIWCEKFLEDPGFLGSGTFGGNPPATVAALAALKTVIDEDVPSICAAKGKRLKGAMEEIKEKYTEIVRDVRGEGLLIGIEFCCKEKASEVKNTLLKKHRIITKTGLNAPNVILLSPSYMVSDESIGKLKDSIIEILS